MNTAGTLCFDVAEKLSASSKRSNSTAASALTGRHRLGVFGEFKLSAV